MNINVIQLWVFNSVITSSCPCRIMKVYRGVEVNLHSFLTLAIDRVSGQPHAMVGLLWGIQPSVPNEWHWVGSREGLDSFSTQWVTLSGIQRRSGWFQYPMSDTEWDPEKVWMVSVPNEWQWVGSTEGLDGFSTQWVTLSGIQRRSGWFQYPMSDTEWDPEKVWMVSESNESLEHARNQTKILWMSSLLPSHYTDYTILAPTAVPKQFLTDPIQLFNEVFSNTQNTCS
jgi:hypothetical protein